MKRFILAVCCAIVFAQTLSAVEYSLGGETIVLIAALPNTDDYAVDGTFVDIGIIFKSFAIAGIPIINYYKRWCVFSGSTYWAVDKQTLDEIAGGVNIILPAGFELPFWYAWGGKLFLLGILVFAAIIGLFIDFCKYHGGRKSTLRDGQICKNCGTPLAAGHKFCTKCGTHVAVEHDAPLQ